MNPTQSENNHNSDGQTIPPDPSAKVLPAETPFTGWKLTFLNGMKAGEIIQLNGDVHFGRSNQNEVILPDSKTSRRHAVLLQTSLGYDLQDLGSSNGTFLNDQPVTIRQSVWDGDEMIMGETKLKIYGRVRPTPVPPAPPPMEPAAQTSGKQAFCTNCGSPLSPQANFCGKCGTRLK